MLWDVSSSSVFYKAVMSMCDKGELDSLCIGKFGDMDQMIPSVINH